MHRAIRYQADDKFDEYDARVVTNFDPAEDMTRQEYAADADINTLLRRYGVGVPQKQVVYGEADFSMDLQQAFGAVEAAKRMFDQLPGELKKKYPTWQAVLNAIESRQLALDLRTLDEQESDTRRKRESESPPETRGAREVDQDDRPRAGSRRGGKSRGSQGESDDSDA